MNCDGRTAGRLTTRCIAAWGVLVLLLGGRCVGQTAPESPAQARPAPQQVAPQLAAPQKAMPRHVAGPPGIQALKALELALADLIERVEPAVVAVTHQAPARDANQRTGPAGRPRLGGDDNFFLFDELRATTTRPQPPVPSGAGIVIDDRGLVLTQYLVVKPGHRHFVTTSDGKRHSALIKAADPRSGLAVLEASDLAIKPIKIGQAEKLRKGSGVVAIGNPYAVLSDGQATASYGAITNLARKAEDGVNLNNATDGRPGSFRTTIHHYGALIQSDARLGWNASGGALVNLDGELIGVTTTVSMIAGHEQPAGYAIPLNQALRRIVATLSEGKEVEYGLLGISFDGRQAAGGAVSGDAEAQAGITVQQAYAGGPASLAGIKPRDTITHIGDQPVPNADRLQLLVGQHPPGTAVEVRLIRSGESQQVQVTLGKHFAVGEKVVTTPAPTWQGIRVDYATAIAHQQLEQVSRQGLIDPAGCVLVADVEPESVSWRRGVRQGMFISHVSNVRVATPKDFWDAIQEAENSVKLRFTRPLPDVEL